jgi:lipopolysaccharide transport system ATP-binding protein
MSRPAVRFRDVGKMYRIYPSRRDNVLDSLGLARLFPWRGVKFREFWALRGIDLDVEAGKRLGIIGRNGAGKSTLLKMMTGNVTPSHGVVEVNGRVQALLEAGGGLHPEFSGHENIYAALTYQGLSSHEIAAQTVDIEEFTELGDFLDQPLKTYSLGMQARLAFAIATTVSPEILIIDEVLGAGDAYFFTKSTERMAGLVESGATVLLVTHALEQITRFCEEAIWLERGRIVAQGPALEVIKAYQAYIRRLEDRRLRAKNRKAQTGRYDVQAQELYADTVLLRLNVASGACDVSEAVLLRDGEPEDTVSVGDAQDADSTQSAFVVAESGWSSPRAEGALCFRRMIAPEAAPGNVQFHLWTLYDESAYAVEVTYRTSVGSAVTLEVLRNGEVVSDILLESSTQWRTGRLVLQAQDTAGARSPLTFEHRAADPDEDVTRWPGLGSLMIERVRLLGADDQERAVYSAGAHMKLELVFRAQEAGRFPVTLAVILYRIDGIRVSTHIGEPEELALELDERRTAVLDFGPLNLGDGRYVSTVVLYKVLSASGPSPYYDLIAHSYEFEVVDNPAFTGVFQHPGAWFLS